MIRTKTWIPIPLRWEFIKKIFWENREKIRYRPRKRVRFKIKKERKHAFDKEKSKKKEKENTTEKKVINQEFDLAIDQAKNKPNFYLTFFFFKKNSHPWRVLQWRVQTLKDFKNPVIELCGWRARRELGPGRRTKPIFRPPHVRNTSFAPSHSQSGITTSMYLLKITCSY